MSISRLPREQGIVIRCNGKDDDMGSVKGCPETIFKKQQTDREESRKRAEARRAEQKAQAAAATIEPLLKKPRKRRASPSAATAPASPP